MLYTIVYITKARSSSGASCGGGGGGGKDILHPQPSYVSENNFYKKFIKNKL